MISNRSKHTTKRRDIPHISASTRHDPIVVHIAVHGGVDLRVDKSRFGRFGKVKAQHMKPSIIWSLEIVRAHMNTFEDQFDRSGLVHCIH